MIRDLSDRQSDVRELLGGVRQEQDKTKEEGLAGNLGYDDEVIVAVVLATLENTTDPARPIGVIDLLRAGGFLDHLDTLGMAVRPRKMKKRHKK